MRRLAAALLIALAAAPALSATRHCPEGGRSSAERARGEAAGPLFSLRELTRRLELTGAQRSQVQHVFETTEPGDARIDAIRAVLTPLQQQQLDELRREKRC